jgi:predicted dithiol-disulfide oxidoreductase (DUF899 family)
MSSPASAGSFPGWPVEKEYAFQTADGPRPLAELFDGRSRTEKATREWVAPMLEGGLLPPIAAQNASASGTDIVRYLAEGFGVNTFARESDTVYDTYSSTSRGVESLMGYYPILDRTPKGRDEGNAFQTWLQRHDEYESE